MEYVERQAVIPENLSAIAARRGRTYWLLARAFAEIPSPALFGEFAQSLGSVEPQEAMGAESAAFADAVRAVLDGKSYEALAVEFTRLFGGLSASYGGLPPIESVVRSGSWGGDVVLGVVASYDEAEIAPPLPEATPPDHLTAELRFLAIACQRESEAWQALDRVQARRWLDCQRGFLDQHLLRWLPAYCQTKIALTETPFYRALLTLAPLACALDREDIDTIVASLRNDA